MSLPPGWKPTIDPSSGNTYYYHEVTREVRWDPPTAADAPPEPEGPPEPFRPSEPTEPAPEPATGRAEGAASAAASGAPDGSGMFLTAAQRAIVSAATASSSLDTADPAAMASSGQQRGEAVSRLEAVLNAIDSQSGVSADAHHWVQQVDPATNKVCYYNRKTGATQWDKPAAMEKAEQMTKSLVEAARLAEEGAKAAGVPKYDPIAEAAKARQMLAERAAAMAVQGPYSSAAAFNAGSGRFEGTGDAAKVGYDRAARQMSQFFDLSQIDANRAEAAEIRKKIAKSKIDWSKYKEDQKKKRFKARNQWLYDDSY